MGIINRFNAVTARLARIKTVRGAGDGPMLSLSFDDFPRSAWTRGGAILAARGAKATYYAAGRFCRKTVEGVSYYDRDDLRAVAAAGHEIGCHTFSHKYATQISSAEFRDDCARNRDFLAEILGAAHFPSFAYPYGDVSVRVKAEASRMYATARGIRAGVNADSIDLALLRAMPLESRSWSAAAMEAVAAATARTRGWLILFTHDVEEAPSPYGCTPRMLEQALEIAAGHGLQSLTVGAAAERLMKSTAMPSRLDKAA